MLFFYMFGINIHVANLTIHSIFALLAGSLKTIYLDRVGNNRPVTIVNTHYFADSKYRDMSSQFS